MVKKSNNVWYDSCVRPIWFCADLPATEYTEILALQHKLVTARKEKQLDKNVLLLLEHFPVFTLGRRGGRENLTVSENYLEKSGIQIIQIERGGNITFHGPGQLIGYPIIDLRQAGLSVLKYVENLEEVMIRTAAHWGIRAERNPLNRGIWAGNSKLGSIGIAVRRNIAFHGFALNVNMQMEPFDWINPCGLQGIRMTSVARECSQNISVNEIREIVKCHMKTVFGINLSAVSLSELGDSLETD